MIETDRARIKIVKILPINNKIDRIYYRDIVKYKKALVDATAANDQAMVAVYKSEIQKKRRILRANREQTYIFDIFLKKYKVRKQIEMNFLCGSPRSEYAKFLKDAENRALTHYRNDLKQKISPKVVNFGKKWAFLRHGNKEKGYVFTEEGSILKAHVQKNMKMLSDNKYPVAQRRYVGIELEFCAPIREEQLAVKLFRNGIHKFAQLKNDGSLRPHEGETSFEIALLLEETTYKRDLKKVTSLLNEVKAVAKDRRCGLHVHIDMRRRNKDLVYNNLVACQYALLSVVDPNRYNNEFCRVVTGRKFPTEFTGDRAERYKTINAAAYYKYKTLEIRMHEGSVSFHEISHWVDLLLKVANYSKYLKNDVTKLPTLKTRLKLKKNLYEYALERSCSWQIQNNPNARNMREDIADLLARPPARVQVARQQPEARGIDAILNNHAIFQRFIDAPIPAGDNFEIRMDGQPVVPMPEENIDLDDDLMQNEDEG